MKFERLHALSPSVLCTFQAQGIKKGLCTAQLEAGVLHSECVQGFSVVNFLNFAKYASISISSTSAELNPLIKYGAKHK